MFSIGSLFYTLLTGKEVFNEQNSQLLLIANKKCDLKPIIRHLSGFSEEVKDLLLSLLCTIPQLRLNTREALSHSWFKNDHKVLFEQIEENDKLAKLSKYSSVFEEKKKVCLKHRHKNQEIRKIQS